MTQKIVNAEGAFHRWSGLELLASPETREMNRAFSGLESCDGRADYSLKEVLNKTVKVFPAPRIASGNLS